MLRKVFGVIGGVVIAFVLVQAAEMIVHAMYPPPPGTDMQNMAAVKAFVAKLPVPAFLLVLFGWLVGTLVGTSSAARIGRSRVPAYVVGTVLLCAGIANAVMIPQPLWFSVASFIIFILMTLAGANIVVVTPQNT